jgi:hypothetical protein
MSDIESIDGMVAEEIAGMIQSHKNHHQSSGYIDFRKTIGGHRLSGAKWFLKSATIYAEHEHWLQIKNDDLSSVNKR